MSVHMLGAALAFLGGVFYMWVFVVVGFVVRPPMTSLRHRLTRLLLVLLATLAVLVPIVNNHVPRHDANGTVVPVPTMAPHHIMRVEWGSRVSEGWDGGGMKTYGSSFKLVSKFKTCRK